MVERRVTDGRRIAQLLASELTGLETGPLGDVAVADADPDVEPSPDGSFAYAITHRGDRVGSAFVHDDRVRVELAVAAGSTPDVDEATDRVRVEPSADGLTMSIESGAAVKDAVDVVAATLATR